MVWMGVEMWERGPNWMGRASNLDIPLEKRHLSILGGEGLGSVGEPHLGKRKVELEPIDKGVFREVDGSAGAKVGPVCLVGDEEALAGKVEGGRPN